jgi:chemotaxis protein CheD
MMNPVVVGIGECHAVCDASVTLVTYALGSCVGVAVFDPVASVGGLLHVLLPESSLDVVRSASQPCLFADTGLTELLSRCVALGAAKARMKVWLAGGAAVMDDRGVFNIGKRNQLAMKRALWKEGLILSAEDVGGTQSRTMRLNLSRGDCWIRSGAGEERELTGRAHKAQERVVAAGGSPVGAAALSGGPEPRPSAVLRRSARAITNF